MPISTSEPTDDPTSTFLRLRDSLLEHSADLPAATQAYDRPAFTTFNWAADWVDHLAETDGTRDQAALTIIDLPDGTRTSVTFAQLAVRSKQVAGWLSSLGVSKGDRVLVMLSNQLELWEVMLAAIRLGAVTIPATTLLTSADLRDRVDRGRVSCVVCRSDVSGAFATVTGDYVRVAVGDPVDEWTSYGLSADFTGDCPRVVTAADDPLLLYFTSGTTSRPKLVEHTQVSYPVGHLSTMYWIGLRPGDVHLNISSPGWAKHAWSCLFAPWNAAATIMMVNQPRFDAVSLLETMVAEKVTTFCAPPTVYRMMIQTDLASYRDKLSLREMVGAGEPLNPEVIGQVEKSLGITIRDGYGQTETTAQIGNTPGQRLKPGSMGRPLPGYEVVLVDPVSGAEVTGPDAEGEICLRLDGPGGRPIGLMTGYTGDADRTAEAMRGGVYHTGDVASRDTDGYVTYVGRADDVFKASDYRISPFELESVLIEHPLVAEAAVVPSPDPTRLSVPKAYVVLVQGHSPSAETARDIMRFAREHLAPYKRIRRIEFYDLPKTISGKIRRVELRQREAAEHGDGSVTTSRASAMEFWESDFPDLKS